MCENLKKSKQLVGIVAESLILDFVSKAKEDGLTLAQIKINVDEYVKSPEFILAIERKIEEILEKLKAESDTNVDTSQRLN